MQWLPFAMVRITVFFAAGATLCICQPQLITEQQSIVLFLVFSLFYFPVRLILRFSRTIKLASGLIGLSAVFTAGYLTVLLRDESRIANHYIQREESTKAYQVKLITPAEEKSNSWKRVGIIKSILTEAGWEPATGRVNLYWPKGELVSGFDYGDILLIKGHPRRIDHAYNPYEFDFSKFQHFKNTYHQHYVRPGEWSFLSRSVDRGLLFYAQPARNASVSVFKRLIKEPREQGILMALVLGVTDGLDNELLSAYSASGAMHVLAVSGLHVSIIYGILLFFFKPFRKTVAGEWMIAMVSLMLLWGYAFITGLSPSVLRAVMMFSFVVIARPLGRNTNIYNTLAASAFCLLLYDPYLLMSVGFQLSYLAVWGIIYLQRPLQNLWEPPTAFLHWAWQITTVSIAAQIATLALSIYFFHQFPVYFLISNLFVIPASCVVLVGGILLLFVNPIPLIATWLGLALEWFARMMNEGIFLMERLPLSVISNLSVNTIQCYLLFFIILGWTMLLQFRKFKYLTWIFCCAVLFSFAAWYQFYDNGSRAQWIVYRVQGHNAMEWVFQGNAFFLSDSVLSKDPQKIKFHIQPNRIASHFRNDSMNTKIPSVTSHGICLFRMEGNTFLWIQSDKFQLPDNLKVDYLVISNNSVKSLRLIADHILFERLILDSSNSHRYCERIETEAKSFSMTVYSVLKKGAFVTNL